MRACGVLRGLLDYVQRMPSMSQPDNVRTAGLFSLWMKDITALLWSDTYRPQLIHDPLGFIFFWTRTMMANLIWFWTLRLRVNWLVENGPVRVRKFSCTFLIDDSTHEFRSDETRSFMKSLDWRDKTILWIQRDNTSNYKYFRTEEDCRV